VPETRPQLSNPGLTPYLVLAILVLGSGLAIGLGLSEAPPTGTVTSSPVAHIASVPAIPYPISPRRAVTSPTPLSRLCSTNQLSATAASLGSANGMFAFAFYVTNEGSQRCAIPSAGVLTLLTQDGVPAAEVGRPGYPLARPGFLELLPDAANRAALVASVGNWCGAPSPPTESEITLASVGSLYTPLDLDPRNFQGIMCYDPTRPPLTVSPVAVVTASAPVRGSEVPAAQRAPR
jgi:hypothetical protein